MSVGLFRGSVFFQRASNVIGSTPILLSHQEQPAFLRQIRTQLKKGTVGKSIKLLRRLEPPSLARDCLLQYYKLLNRAYIQYIKRFNTKKLDRQKPNQCIEQLVTQVHSLFAPWLLLIFQSLSPPSDSAALRVQQFLSSQDGKHVLRHLDSLRGVSDNKKNRFLRHINKFFEYYV